MYFGKRIGHRPVKKERRGYQAGAGIIALALFLLFRPGFFAPGTETAGKAEQIILASEATEAAGEEADEILENFCPWLESLRAMVVRALYEIRAERESYPKVIDRWTDPKAYPGFSFSPDEELLEIWFPRIRDRDAAIFLYQGECWMLDCSDEQAEERVVPLLKALDIRRIDRLFNTHPHPDHLNGLYAVDKISPVSELLICFPEEINDTMKNAVAYAAEQRIRVTFYGDEQVFSMGNGMVRFQVWMKSGEEETLNDQSAQFMVSYGSCDMLFMADMEVRGQIQLLAAVGANALKADILRYPHHGKKAMAEGILPAIRPDFVVITGSEGTPEVRESTKFLEYYDKNLPRAYTTRGYLHLVTDGVRWICEKVDDETLFEPLEDVNAPAMTIIQAH